MKKTIFLTTILFAYSIAFGQQAENFDIISFKTPRGWQKEDKSDAIQMGVEDSKGGVCLITLFKSIPGGNDSKANFNAAWEAIVMKVVTVNSEPQMNPVENQNGWIVESGVAQYESDGKKGAVILITATGSGKMVNFLILTNTDSFQNDVDSFIASVQLPKITSQISKSNTSTSITAPSSYKSSFKYSNTNFDDGWTSVEQEDWVEVIKGNIKVLIHYPKEGTIFPADPEPLTNTAWNILVAPRYSNLKNYKTSYINTYNRPYLGMGYATENASGKQVFILLFRQGDSGWLEFITPDKNSFIQQYKFDPEAIRWDSESDLLKPLMQMGNYNKFAVSESDFSGTWTSDFTGVQQMYHIYTGNYAGMKINQSNEEFVFGSGNSYSWKLLVVNGMVGNMNYANVKSAGKFSVLNNWQVHFSQIESKPKTYYAYWSCIKGARLLHLLDANAPGSGIYTIFGKK